MAKTKIIFHYPGNITKETNTGEKKRPQNILQAFHENDFEVISLTGTYQERQTIFQYVKQQIQDYAFVYSENSNMPLALTGSSRLPILNSIDYELFSLAAEKNVPAGVFIRDVFWNVPETVARKAKWKQWIGKKLFQHEFNHYIDYCHTVFLPTMAMKTFLPQNSYQNFVTLPPGANTVVTSLKKLEKPLRLVYVGSCQPPVYQVFNTFNFLKNLDFVELTIISRKEEHPSITTMLHNQLGNIKLLSAFGKILSEILQQQHIALACIDKNTYWDIAMPVKIFDYVSHLLPIISYTNGETAALIQQNNLGWVVPDIHTLQKLLENVTQDEYQQKNKSTLQYQKQNTWRDRIQYISNTLLTPHKST